MLCCSCSGRRLTVCCLDRDSAWCPAAVGPGYGHATSLANFVHVKTKSKERIESKRRFSNDLSCVVLAARHFLVVTLTVGDSDARYSILDRDKATVRLNEMNERLFFRRFTSLLKGKQLIKQHSALALGFSLLLFFLSFPKSWLLHGEPDGQSFLPRKGVRRGTPNQDTLERRRGFHTESMTWQADWMAPRCVLAS